MCLFLSIYKFMFVGLNYLGATSFGRVEGYKKMEIQLQEIGEEWEEAERKCLGANTLFQVASKKLETMKKEQLEV